MPDVAGWPALLGLAAVLTALALACVGIGRYLRQWGRARRAGAAAGTGVGKHITPCDALNAR